MRLAQEIGMPTKQFSQKTQELKKRHDLIVNNDLMYLSDEMDTEVSLTDKQKKFMHEHVMGYTRDYFQGEEE